MLNPKKTNFNEKEAIRVLSNKYGFQKDELKSILEQKKSHIIKQEKIILETIPISIINNKTLSPLETIVKYLRENKNLTYKQIGQLLTRNPKTLAVTYSIAQKKNSEPIILTDDSTHIECSVFKKYSTTKLSILETICHHLKTEGLHHNQISKILGKNQKTIWTVCKRAENKFVKEKSDRGEIIIQ